MLKPINVGISRIKYVDIINKTSVNPVYFVLDKYIELYNHYC